MRPMSIFCGPSDTPFLKNIYPVLRPSLAGLSLLALRGPGAPRVKNIPKAEIVSAGELHPDVVALAMNRDPWRLFRRETQTSSSPIVFLPRSVRYADAAPPQSPRQTQGAFEY